jgi:manganese/zinc/iron transport system ATP- binding protein
MIALSGPDTGLHEPGLAVHVEDLTVSYHGRPVLWDIDLDVPPGVMAAVVGPNGAGKSTLVKAILGLVPPTAGHITIHGRPYRAQRRRVGYVPQRSTVDWDFPTTAIDVVTMGLYGQLGWFRRPGRADRARARDALDRVGMAGYADRQISQLSGGQQQRVFLARALVQDADVYFLDEPMAGVDATTERAIVDILHGLRDAGKTVVVVHHDLSTVSTYFDWMLILNVRVIAQGPVSRVYTVENLHRAYGGQMARLERGVFGDDGTDGGGFDRGDAPPTPSDAAAADSADADADRAPAVVRFPGAR